MLSRRLPRPVLLGATVLVIVAAVAAVARLRRDDGPERPSAADVRSLVLEDLDSSATVELGDVVDGRPAVVNFFANWCQPCREEMPAFEIVHQELQDDVAFVGIAAPGEKPELSLKIVEETGVTYPTFTDRSGEATSLFEALMLPTTVFIDADGQVVDVLLAKFDEAALRDEIAEQLVPPA
jgi:thiol-disulfide isomerase/thioredoxin